MNTVTAGIIAQATGCTDDVAKKAAASIEKSDKIASEVYAKQLELIEADNAHDAYRKRIGTEIRAIQLTCEHPSTSYYPDAAGGSDSLTTCDVCSRDLNTEDFKAMAAQRQKKN